jgi:hypothetical protein
MRIQPGSTKKFHLAKETIRGLLSSEMRQVVGGGGSCGADSACDCSSDAGTSSICTNQGSLYCTHFQY